MEVETTAWREAKMGHSHKEACNLSLLTIRVHLHEKQTQNQFVRTGFR